MLSVELTPIGSVSLGAATVRSGSLIDDFDLRWHLWLALGSLAVGAAVALARAMLGRRPDAGGRLVVSLVAVAAVLKQQQAIGWWAACLAVVAAGVLAVGASSRDTGLVGVLAAMSLAGVWASVPDTESALAAVCVVGVVAVLGPVLGRSAAAFTVGDRLAAVVLVVATARIGSAGRSEIVGGIACIGLLCVPLALPAAPTADPAPTALRRHLSVVAIHGVLVLVASRGITRLAWRPALVAAAGVALVALAVSVGLARLATSSPTGSAPR